MDEYFGPRWSGDPFHPFDASHVTLLVVVALCAVLTFVAAAALWTRHRVLAAPVRLLGTPGALMALLMPEVAPFGFPHYRVLQSWTQHLLLLLAGFWLVFVERIRPTWSNVWKAWMAVHGLAALAFVANHLTGGNYLYVSRTPPFATIIDALPPWPGYLLVLEGLLVVIMLAFWGLGRPAPARRTRSEREAA